MKQKIVYSLIALLLSLPALVNAQSQGNPVIYKDWEMLVETTNLLDVSYRVIKCDSANQIHLLIFNENVMDQNAHFDMEITNNDTGEKYTKEISFAATKATVYKAMCDSDASLDKLRFNIPANFNPNNLTVKISFKP